MPYYLPLGVTRQELLPIACRSCVWWQTTGDDPSDPAETTAADARRQWMAQVESTWGSTGLLLAVDETGESVDSAAGVQPSTTRKVLASINYAPAASVPRFRELPFSPLPTGAVLLFCLMSAGERDRSNEKRLLRKAFEQLKNRDVQEVYAVAVKSSRDNLDGRCEFFSLDFVEANGFVRVRDDGYRYLVRAELRNLKSVIAPLEAALRRILRGDPAPSPATWTRRGW